jgi:hypothetical protein
MLMEHTNDGDIVLWGLELPESDIDGDTTLTLGLKFVKNPCVLEGTLAQLGGFLLKMLDREKIWMLEGNCADGGVTWLS